MCESLLLVSKLRKGQRRRMRRSSEEQGGSSGSYYKLTKLDHLLPSWESLVILDSGATHRKDGNESIQYSNCSGSCLSCFHDITAVAS